MYAPFTINHSLLLLYRIQNVSGLKSLANTGQPRYLVQNVSYLFRWCPGTVGIMYTPRIKHPLVATTQVQLHHN